MYASLLPPPPQSQNFQFPEIIVEQNAQKDGEEKDGEKEPAAAVLATETAVRGKKILLRAVKSQLLKGKQLKRITMEKCY